MHAVTEASSRTTQASITFYLDPRYTTHVRDSWLSFQRESSPGKLDFLRLESLLTRSPLQALSLFYDANKYTGVHQNV